ncbi:MAG: OmpA family protein [Syntrophobacteria bacterium]|nr:OmpA family protein [Deltaproteobacteria bacterium]
MYRKPSLFVLCSLLLLLSACVSKSKYVQLETEHADAKDQLRYTETRLGYTDESREKCIDSLADCQGRFKEKEGEKVQLSQEREELQVSLEESETTIAKQTKVIRDLHATRIKIESSLKEQIESQEIKLEEIEGKLKVTLVDKILFDTGKVELAKRGKEVLLELADTLRENKDQNIVVEGHTDDVPIGLGLIEKYPTNWELSAVRAVGVVRFLQEKGWLEPERLTATGYSYYKPVAANDTAEGRRQNRRIEIILVPKR